MAHTRPPLRKSRPHYRSGTQRLPHPSWRQAVGGTPEPDGRAPPSASEFWDALGL